MGDGDGTVPIQSLLAIKEVWTNSAALVNVGFE